MFCLWQDLIIFSVPSAAGLHPMAGRRGKEIVTRCSGMCQKRREPWQQVLLSPRYLTSKKDVTRQWYMRANYHKSVCHLLRFSSSFQLFLLFPSPPLRLFISLTTPSRLLIPLAPLCTSLPRIFEILWNGNLWRWAVQRRHWTENKLDSLLCYCFLCKGAPCLSFPFHQCTLYTVCAL